MPSQKWRANQYVVPYQNKLYMVLKQKQCPKQKGKYINQHAT